MGETLTGRLWAAAAFALTLVCMTPGIARAQNASDSSSSSNDEKLDEIVVTAQRREEYLSDAPLAITALTGKQLESLGVSDSRDLTNVAPNLLIGLANNSTLVTLRGIGILTSNDVLSPSVQFNVDGVVMGRPRSATMQFYDLDRVEVLRGPQGTLYGRNAIAGSINLITNQPSFDGVDGTLLVGAGNEGRLETEGALNVPVNDKFAFRVAGRAETHDYYNEVADVPANGLAGIQHGNQDKVDSYGGRVSTIFQPTDDLRWKVVADVSRIDGNNDTAVYLPVPVTTLAGLETRNPVAGATRASDFINPLAGYQRLIAYGANSDLSYEFPVATLTYQFGFRRFDQFQDEFPTYFSAASVVAPQVSSLTFYTTNEYTHELRLNSRPEQDLKWVVGAYRYYDNQDYLYQVRPLLPPPGSFSNVLDHPDSATTSYAVFGQATYPLLKLLDLTAGVRYTHDELNAVNIPTIGAADEEMFSSSHTDYRVGLDFKPGDGHLLYAAFATGYKAGGSNYGNGVNFRPEYIDDYEVGYKGRLLDDRLHVNLTGFYFDYKDVQESVLAPNATGISVVLVQNAARATNKGVELELAFQLTKYDRLDASATAQDARFGSFSNCILAGGVPFNCSGTELPTAPDEFARLSYQHTIPFHNGASLSLQAAEQWSSSYNVSLGETPWLEQPSYHTTELSGQWNSGDDAWYIQAYARNIENVAVLTTGSVTGYATIYTIQPPRLFGFRAGYKF
jgi:iron complex outermembrane receptor protein